MDSSQPMVTDSNKLYILPWLICGLAALFYCYEYLLRVAPSVMMHEVMSAYHLNARTFGALSASYYYIYAPMQMLVGILMDRYGPRWLLTLAVLSCSVGIYLFASSHFLWVAETGRLLVGFGSAFAFVGALKLATIWLPPNRFALMAGSTLALGMVGGVMGDVLLTHMTSIEGWRFACFAIACIGLLLTLAIFLLVRDRHGSFAQRAKPMLAPSFAELWSDTLILIRSRGVWVNALVGCLLYLPLSGFAESWGIPYLMENAGLSHQKAATATSMIFLGWAMGGPLMGWLSDQIKQRRMVITLGAAASTVLLAYILYVPQIRYQMLLALLVLFGACSSVQAITFPIARELSPERSSGTVIALTNMVVMSSGVSVWVIGVMLESFWHGLSINGLHVYSPHSYQLALLILPASLLLTVFLTFFLPETYGKQEAHIKPLE